MIGDGFLMRALQCAGSPDEGAAQCAGCSDESATQCACERHRVLRYQQVRFGDWSYISQERIMLNLVLDSGINL